MDYYKVILRNKIIDVLEDVVWVRLNRRGAIVVCSPSEATGVVGSDNMTIWHISGTPAIGEYEDVTVADIDETEAETLKKLLGLDGEITESGDGIDVSWDEEKPTEEVPPPANLAELKERCLQNLSQDCQNAIFAGVDVELADHSIKHFDLRIEDQVNLLSLSMLLASNGGAPMPYHASGELCAFYTAEDMQRIITAATTLKTYHTSYYNSLKNWINALSTMEEICAIQYGDTIPEQYCSDVLVQMLGGDTYQEAL